MWLTHCGKLVIENRYPFPSTLSIICNWQRRAQNSYVFFTMHSVLVPLEPNVSSGIRKKWWICWHVSAGWSLGFGVCFCQLKETQKGPVPRSCRSISGDTILDSVGLWNLGKAIETLLLPGVRYHKWAFGLSQDTAHADEFAKVVLFKTSAPSLIKISGSSRLFDLTHFCLFMYVDLWKWE